MQSPNKYIRLQWEMEGQQNASTEQIYKTPMGGTDDEKSSSRSIPVRGKPSRTRANIRSGNTHIIKDFFERAENTPADNTVADERPWRSAKIRKFRKSKAELRRWQGDSEYEGGGGDTSRSRYSKQQKNKSTRYRKEKEQNESRLDRLLGMIRNNRLHGLVRAKTLKDCFRNADKLTYFIVAYFVITFENKILMIAVLTIIISHINKNNL